MGLGLYERSFFVDFDVRIFLGNDFEMDWVCIFFVGFWWYVNDGYIGL